MHKRSSGSQSVDALNPLTETGQRRQLPRCSASSWRLLESQRRRSKDKQTRNTSYANLTASLSLSVFVSVCVCVLACAPCCLQFFTAAGHKCQDETVAIKCCHEFLLSATDTFTCHHVTNPPFLELPNGSHVNRNTRVRLFSKIKRR